MKLYRVGDDVVYWVAARSPAEALGLCIEVEHRNGNDMTDWNGFEAQEQTKEQGRTATLRDDGDPAKDISMQAALEACESPQVLACSEWP